jgi:hypothetical protein
MSKFELLAGQIDQPLMSGYEWADELKEILRLCHQYNHPKYDATWLADVIYDSLAAGFGGPDFGKEGAGWQTDEEIAEAKRERVTTTVMELDIPEIVAAEIVE